MPKKRSALGRRAKAPATRKRAPKRAAVLAVAPAAKRAKRAPIKPVVSVLPPPLTALVKPDATIRSFAILAVILLVTISTGALIRVGQAATFQGPTNDPPQGNIPVTVWNRTATGTKQTNASIDIDGGVTSEGMVTLGFTTPPALTAVQNLIYGNVGAGSAVGSNLLLLQNATVDKFFVDKDGNVVTGGDLSVNGIGNGGNFTLSGPATTGDTAAIHANSLTSGHGLLVDTTSTSFTNASLVQSEIRGIYAATAAVSPTSGTFNRSVSASGAATSLTVNGPVLSARNNCSLLGGAACVVPSNVLYVEQAYAGATGPAIEVSNLGTGPDIRGTGSAWSISRSGKISANGDVAAVGSVTAGACFGPTFAGVTSQTFTGNLNGAAAGYYNSNALCVAAHGAGAHVCSVDEIFNSIKCAVASSPIKTIAASTDAWIQGGPPGYTAPANDCQGWSSSASANLGRIWRYDPASGGKGFLTTCNQTIPFSCCK